MVEAHAQLYSPLSLYNNKIEKVLRKSVQVDVLKLLSLKLAGNISLLGGVLGQVL